MSADAGKRVITSGQLRRRAREGIRSGLFSPEEAERMRDEAIEKGDYYSKKEPGGIVVSKMEEQTQEMESAEKALTESVQRFVGSANDSAKRIQKTSGQIRDSVDKLSAAIQKFMGMASSSDFAKTVSQAESLVDSLERLSKLQEAGKLDRVMSAMNVKSGS